MTMKPTPTPEMIEAAAEAIYNLFTYDEPGEKPKWIERGNSFKQEDARRYAAAALSVPAAAVVGEPEGWKLVPIEPTPEMESKGADAFFSPQPQSIEDENARAASVYRRMLSTAPSAPDGWQPIETAPKDGTTLWVLDELYGKPWHYECNWNGIEWYHGFGVAWPDARPTHWRPLPAPPALGGASHE